MRGNLHRIDEDTEANVQVRFLDAIIEGKLRGRRIRRSLISGRDSMLKYRSNLLFNGIGTVLAASFIYCELAGG